MLKEKVLKDQKIEFLEIHLVDMKKQIEHQQREYDQMMQAIGSGSCDVIRVKGNSPGKDSDDLNTIQNRYEAEIQSL